MTDISAIGPKELNTAPCMCQTICDVTSSKVLGSLAQCEQKGWDRGRWVGIYTQRVKTAWLCLDLAVKIPQYGHCHLMHLIRPPSMQCSSVIYLLELVSTA